VELRRVRSNEWLAAGFGVLLIASLFLDWYGLDIPGNWPQANAWESFAVTDVILAIAGLCGIGLWVGTATQRTPAVQQSMAALTCPTALVASVLAVVRLLAPPSWKSVAGGPAPVRHLDIPVSREIGVYIGVAAVLGLLISAWRSMGDQRFPETVTPEVEVAVLPTPAAGRADSARDE
jgi:hypothetical protein